MKTFLVTEVAVVVDGEQIAELVEGELLGIAQTVGEDLEIGAVGFDAHDAAVSGEQPVPPVFFYADAFVADRPVDASVGSQGRAVHIVPAVADVNAEAVNEFGDFFKLAVAVFVVQPIEAGDAGDERRALVP